MKRNNLNGTQKEETSNRKPKDLSNGYEISYHGRTKMSCQIVKSESKPSKQLFSDNENLAVEGI